MPGLTLWRRDNGEIRSANASLRAIGCGRGPTIDISPSCNIHQLWELVDLLCAETAAAIDEMTNILRRNLRDLHACAGRGETPPLEERLRYKFQSTEGHPRCTLLPKPSRPVSDRRLRVIMIGSLPSENFPLIEWVVAKIVRSRALGSFCQNTTFRLEI